MREIWLGMAIGWGEVMHSHSHLEIIIKISSPPHPDLGSVFRARQGWGWAG